MIEKIGKISNPLTIIAIFAALAEVLGTVTIGIISESVQASFIWFLILFPILIVVSFFFVLYNKPQVLYAPSDFQNEEFFLKAMRLQEVEGSLKKMQRQLIDTKSRILDSNAIQAIPDDTKKQLQETVEENMAPLFHHLEKTKKLIEQYRHQLGSSDPLAVEILRVLADTPGTTTSPELAKKLDVAYPRVTSLLADLVQKGFVIRTTPGQSWEYALNRPEEQE